MPAKLKIESHFTDRDPVVRRIYDRLLTTCGKIGEFSEDPKKTSIHLNRKTAFAGVAVRNSYLILTIKSDQKIKSGRIHKSEQTSKSRYHHEVRLESPSAVDSEILSWLRAAYALSS